MLAIDGLLAAAGDDVPRRRELEWERGPLRAELAPVSLDAAALGRFAGVFGERRIDLRGGKLFYQRTGLRRYELRPLTADSFALVGLDWFRIRFVSDDSGAVVGLRGL